MCNTRQGDGHLWTTVNYRYDPKYKLRDTTSSLLDILDGKPYQIKKLYFGKFIRGNPRARRTNNMMST